MPFGHGAQLKLCCKALVQRTHATSCVCMLASHVGRVMLVMHVVMLKAEYCALSSVCIGHRLASIQVPHSFAYRYAPGPGLARAFCKMPA